MAGTSLLALIDDIASVLDDVALMTKMAAKKTTGVLGDDLALNAQQVSGVSADRELPVVWAVAKGSFINKLILVPLALIISAVIPWAITPLLMLGGAYLCFEGAEKLLHKYVSTDHAVEPPHEVSLAPLTDEEIKTFEKDKIKGAIRTDFILSAEIITITLGAVAGASFLNQVLVLSAIAILMTVGVYGLVAGIVKLDDAGLYLSGKKQAFARQIGKQLIIFTPYLMKLLGVVGTAAMFMVGGGIIAHGILPVGHGIENLSELCLSIPVAGRLLQAIAPTVLNMLFGAGVGAILVLGVMGIGKLGRKRGATQ